MKKKKLITSDYLVEQKKLHDAPQGYGGKGDKWAPAVADLSRRFGANTLLDYGCGRGTLKTALAEVGPWIEVHEYDPAIKGKDTLPERADLVVCTDVLEHIEPELLKDVGAHLFALSKIALFVVIATRKASKTLSDGRNAHLTVEGDKWWFEQMSFCDEKQKFRWESGPRIPNRKPSREWSALFVRK